MAELAEAETFEAVAALLWQVDERDAFGDWFPTLPTDYPARLSALDYMGASERFVSLGAAVEKAEPRLFDLAPAAFARGGAAAIRWYASLLCGMHEPPFEPLHTVLAARVDPGWADIVRRLLVLSADHDLDPSTLTVRAVANTGVTPFRVIMAGLISASGRRAGFGRVGPAARLLDEVLTAADPTTPIVHRLRAGEDIPGFGPKVYAGADPRADALITAIANAFEGDPEVRRLLSAIRVVREAVQLEPDFALMHLFVCRRLGLGNQESGILRLPRMAGWIAHAMEQYQDHELLRPRADYRGPLPEATFEAGSGPV